MKTKSCNWCGKLLTEDDFNTTPFVKNLGICDLCADKGRKQPSARELADLDKVQMELNI